MISLFITEATANSGKNFVTAGLAATMQSLGYQSCVYKPVDVGVKENNGFLQSVELAFVKNLDPYIKTAFTYSFKTDTYALIGAEEENVVINKDNIKKDFINISKEVDCLIAEGTSGIMTPLGIKFLERDLILNLNIPVLFVVKPFKGALNNALLALNCADESGLNIRGVVINNDIDKTDKYELKNLPRLIEEYSNAKILGIIQDFSYRKKIDPNMLITHILNGIDIESVFDTEIAKLKL